ncbi:MAG TPA: hypothetical protein VN791_05815 [Acidimicrobiales bacterium]|nr:hypothetical protein [Acidimicrobiales bacterium]
MGASESRTISGRHLKGGSRRSEVESADPAGRRWKTSLVVGIYAILAVALFHDVWFGHPSTEMQLGSDQYNFTWALQWVPWAVAHGHNPFFSNYLNYPFGVNLLTNAGITGLGLLFAPVTWLFGPIASFNAAETIGIALSATSGYVFVLRFVRWRPAAFAAGLLYGFSPYELAQSSGHLNLSFIALPPLIFLILHDLVIRQTATPRRDGVLLGLLVVAQFFVSTEILFDTALIAVAGLAAAAAFGHRAVVGKLRHLVVGSVWAVGVAGVLLAYPLWFTLDGPAHISGKIQLVPQAYRADLFGLVVPDSRQLITTSHWSHIANLFASSITENGSYIGIPFLLVLVVSTLALWRVAVVRVAAVCALAALVLSLGNGLVVHTEPPAMIGGFPLPGRLLAELPLLKNAIPARFALFVSLFAALMLAVALDRLYRWSPQRWSGRRWRGWTGPALVATVCFVPLIPAPFTGIGQTGIPVFFTTPAVHRIPTGSTAVIYPFPSDNVPNGALWQAVTDMRFRQPGTTFLVPGGPDGGVAFSPAIGYDRSTLTARVLIEMDEGHTPAESPGLRAGLRRQLGAWKVQSFVAFPLGSPGAPQAVTFLTWLFGRPPVISAGGTYGWFGLRL